MFKACRFAPFFAVLLAALALSSCAIFKRPPNPSITAEAATPPEGLVKLCIFHPEVCPTQMSSPEALRPSELAAVSLISEAAPVGGIPNPATARAFALVETFGPVGSVGTPDDTAAAANIIRVEAPSASFTRPSGQDITIGQDISRASAPNSVRATPTIKADTRAAAESESVPDSPALMNLARRVNHDINKTIKPRTDVGIYGQLEHWTMPLTFGTGFEGDCEDYALEKRHALIEAGVPAKNLVFAVAHSDFTGRHAVLILLHKGTEYVLDNVDPVIRQRDDTPYRWIKRQITGTDAFNWAYYRQL